MVLIVASSFVSFFLVLFLNNAVVNNAFLFSTTTPTNIRPTPFGVGWLSNTKNRVRKGTAKSSSSEEEEEEMSYSSFDDIIGLYRPFVEYVWSALNENKNVDLVSYPESNSASSDLQCNKAPARGYPNNTAIVKIETGALKPSSTSTEEDPVVRYARYALLETLVLPQETTTTSDKDDSSSSSSCNNNSTNGIQVLNIVIFPSKKSIYPVWAADFVALPGNKHLFLLDVQPMINKTKYTEEQDNFNNYYEHWYQKHVATTNDDDEKIYRNFPWGGDIPPAVSKYVSKYALWSRMGGGGGKKGDKNGNDDSPIPIIQSKLFDAYKQHVDIYLELLQKEQQKQNQQRQQGIENHQDEYITYRKTNDPARPMLKSLYGEIFTERVLNEILFPQ